MKFKKNLILLLVLVVTVVVVLFVERPFEDKAKKDRQEAALLFPLLQTEEVKKIELIRPDDAQPILLKKLDTAWYVMQEQHVTEGVQEGAVKESKEESSPATLATEPYPADENAVMEALEKLKNLKEVNLTSRLSEKHELFEVTEGKGIEVAAYGSDDKNVAALIIGKEGPDIFSTYIRKKGSNEVYLFDEFLKGSFDREVNGWRDRKIFDFESELVTELKIAGKVETIALQKDENSTWQIQEPKTTVADSAKVTSMLTSLSRLRAGKFADGTSLEGSGLDHPETEITIAFEDGSTKRLLIGDQKEENYFYAKAADKKYIYEIHKSVVEKLTPSLEDLEKAESDKPAAGEPSSPAPSKGSGESPDSQ